MSDHDSLSQQDVVERLRAAGPAMLTTALPDGTLVSHPMTIQHVDDDADVWLFIGLGSGQAEALRGDPAVNLAVAETGSWLSLAGRASFVEDPQRIRELWNDAAAAYFPEGPQDPDLGLLRITGESAQYWGVPGGRVAALAQILKARVTGDRPAGGSATTEL